LTPPTFYSTCAADQLRPFMPATPIMLTATSHWRIGQRRQKWRVSGAIPPVLHLPPQVPEVAADSGGFVAAHRYGGRYPFSFEAYRAWLTTIPRLTWAALPDLPVERELAPSYAHVRQRQELTLQAARELWGPDDTEVDPVPWSWVATIQGREVDDYVWMASQLGPLLVEQRAAYHYTAYAVDRYDWDGELVRDPELFRWAEHGAAHARVGIGSLCRRTNVAEIVAIVRAVAEVLPGERFHLWGVKLGALAALRRAGLLHLVASLDSAAWNGRFGSDLEAPRSSGLNQRAYAWTVAWPAYQAKLAAALRGPAPARRTPPGQLSLAL
jgi:hypothetical protein